MHPIEHLFQQLSALRVVDLSPLIEKGIPRFPTHPHLVIDQTVTHEHDGYYCQSLQMAEHTASHVDAPAHIHPHLMDVTIEQFSPDYLIRPAVRYDLSKFDPKPGELITAEHIVQLEKEMNEQAKEGDVVLLHFGWMKYWANDHRWKWYASNAPGLTEEAVRLFAERNVRAVGSDTIACDQAMKDGVAEKSYGHDVYWLPQQILIMESLANLDQVSDRSLFVAAPLRIKRGSGSPIRAMAYCV